MAEDWEKNWDLVPVDDDPFAPMSASEMAARRAKLYDPEEIKRVTSLDVSSWVENQKAKLLAIGKALAAPGNALGGKYGLATYGDGSVHEEPAFFEDASALAGLLPVGGMAMPRPAGSLGVFGGIRAATADLDKLNAAKQMKLGGASSYKIWQQTGWFKGADGEYRFEIPDRESFFAKNEFTRVMNEFDRAEQIHAAKQKLRYDWMYEQARERGYENMYRMPTAELDALSKQADFEFPQASLRALQQRPKRPTLEQVLEHPELFKAYPDFKKIELERETGERNFGSWLPGGNKVALRTEPSRQLAVEGAVLDPHSTLLHEIQHGIQETEGWLGRGANPNASHMKEAGARVIERIKSDIMHLDHQFDEWRAAQAKRGVTYADSAEARDYWDPDMNEERANLLEQLFAAKFDPAFAAYAREGGEVEARNVQKRFRVPDSHRPPWITQEFPYREQLLFANSLMK